MRPHTLRYIHIRAESLELAYIPVMGMDGTHYLCTFHRYIGLWRVDYVTAANSAVSAAASHSQLSSLRTRLLHIGYVLMSSGCLFTHRRTIA